MAIEETTHLYEVLLRFGPQGLIGAHQCRWDRAVNTETGRVYKDEPLPPEPVTPEALAGLVDPQVPLLAAQVVDLLGRVDAQARQIGVLQQAGAELHSANGQLAAQVAAMAEKIALQDQMLIRAQAAVQAASPAEV